MNVHPTTRRNANDLIYVVECEEIDSERNVINPHAGVYNIHYVRFRNNEGARFFLSGVPTTEMGDELKLKVAIEAPDGSPIGEEHHHGVYSVNRAIAVARNARVNPDSTARLGGCSEDTPIYLWQFARRRIAVVD